MFRTSLLLLCCLLPAGVPADTLGLRVGAGYQDFDVSGSVRYGSADPANDIDVRRDLGYGDAGTGYAYVSVEHPLPLLPNVRLSRTELDESATGMLTGTFEYGGVSFVAGEQVSSSARLEQTDITLYYSLLDTVTSIDLGVNARYLDSDVRISGALTGSARAKVSGWLPMAYAGFGVDLPLTGLALAAEGAASHWLDSDQYDLVLKVSYISSRHLGVEAGYRRLRLELDDFDGSYADLEFEGPFAGLILHF